MKIMKSLTCSLILAAFLVSCGNSKKETAEITDFSSRPQLSAKINGVLQNLSKEDSFIKKGYTPAGTFLTLSCNSTKGIEIQGISINIYNYKGIGKYKIGKTGENKNNFIPPTGSYTKSIIGIPPKIEVWLSKEGEIEIIEEKNGRIRGTFNFITKKGNKQGDKVNITEGKFNLKLST